MITVLLVDDHPLVREAVKGMLTDTPSFKVVGEAHSGEEAVRLCRQHLPHVVLMDLNMPGIGGLEATSKILRVSPETKILVLTMRDDPLFSKRLLQAGAVGYLTKDTVPSEIVRAIRIVHAGQRYLTPTLATQMAMQKICQAADLPFEQLSERELQIAIRITRGEKVVDIATALCISPKTVNSYRYQIFTKLNIRNDVELTHLAVKHGLLENVKVENKA